MSIEKLGPYDIIVEINNDPSQTVVGKLPVNFDFEVASSWSSPFASFGHGTFGNILALGGISLKFQAASVQVWEGSAPINIRLPIEFFATGKKKPGINGVSKSGAWDEVVTPIIRLMKLAAPTLRDANGAAMYDPPGPNVDFGKLAADIVKEIGLDSASDFIRKRTSTGTGDDIVLYLGKFAVLDRLIVKSVIPRWSSVMDPDGIPMKASAEVTFSTWMTPDRNKIEKFFKFPSSSSQISEVVTTARRI